jgi:hypothetical protein
MSPQCAVCWDRGCEFCPRVGAEPAFKPFDQAEYAPRPDLIRAEHEEQRRRFEERRQKTNFWRFWIEAFLLFMFLIGLPLAAWGIHELIHL